MTSKTGRWIVSPADARTRLDRLLSGFLPNESRSQIQNWIRGGSLLVNTGRVKVGYAVKSGDVITLEARAPASGIPEPEDIPLPVLYEDPDLAVIDKPAGLACHSGAGVRSGTLVNALLFRLGTLAGEDPLRPGIVHRLDRQTSGVLLVAKTPQAHRSLSQQFKAREVAKEYLALVHGVPKPAAGVIDLPLGRSSGDRKKISVRSRKARMAVTRYEIIHSYGAVSLLRVKPETGRTHQIRVHLAQKGHPVLGDTLYGGSRDRSLPRQLREKTELLQRHFLHALRIEFRHPSTGGRLSFVAPLPGALQDMIDFLEGRSAPS